LGDENNENFMFIEALGSSTNGEETSKKDGNCYGI